MPGRKPSSPDSQDSFNILIIDIATSHVAHITRTVNDASLSPFYRWEHQSPERVSGLPRTLQLMHRARMHPQVCLTPEPMPCTTALRGLSLLGGCHLPGGQGRMGLHAEMGRSRLDFLAGVGKMSSHC